MHGMLERAMAELGRPHGGVGRILLTGWFSFRDGEVTAGDALAARQLSAALDRSGLAHDTAWSPGFAPGEMPLERADPARYAQLLFVCGPAHGAQVARLHERFAHCRRLAVGVSVVDPADPAVTGFHRVLARDGTAEPPCVDLSATAPLGPGPPLAVVVLTRGQGEYGVRRCHAEVSESLTRWIHGKDCARAEADTRLAVDDWRLCATPEQFLSLVARADVVLTTRLHGLVLSLRAGTPVLAVDPVRGGAKVSAQGRALRWPAVVAAEGVAPDTLDRWWGWCLSGAGRSAAARRARLMGNHTA